MIKRKSSWEFNFESLQAKLKDSSEWPEEIEQTKEFKEMPSVKQEELRQIVDDNFSNWKHGVSQSFRHTMREKAQKPDFVRELFKEAGRAGNQEVADGSP